MQRGMEACGDFEPGQRLTSIIESLKFAVSVAGVLEQILGNGGIEGECRNRIR